MVRHLAGERFGEGVSKWLVIQFAERRSAIRCATGANQGIGKAIARAFAAEGAKLVICARNLAKLGATAAELRGDGADVLATPADVSDEAAAALFKAAMEAYGAVDILVNNAGAFDGGRLDRLTLEGGTTSSAPA